MLRRRYDSAVVYGDVRLGNETVRDGRPLLSDMKLTVIGLPVSQGSKSARVVRGRAIITDGFGSTPRELRHWRAKVAACARLWLDQNGTPPPLDCAVALHAIFYLPRPKSATKRLYPHTKPDLDKLARAIGDALTKLAYVDDSRIVEMRLAKRFADDGVARCEIEVRAREAA